MDNLVKRLNCYIKANAVNPEESCVGIKCEDCEYFQCEYFGMNSTLKSTIERIEFLKRKNKNLKRNLQRVRKKVKNV